MLRGFMRQRTGMSIEDWIKAAGSLETLMQALDQPGRIGDPNRRHQLATMLAGWNKRLERLESSFQFAFQVAGRYVKDPGELARSKEVLAHRRQVVHRVITKIEQIEGS
jgi:hypothetical protein